MNKPDRLTPLEEAFRTVDEKLSGIRTGGEMIAAREAFGRVTLSDQRSRLDLPPFDKSAMDGYAALANDERDEYRVVETIAAGQVGKARLSPGTVVKIMTGAAVPDGTGRVIIVEHAEERGEFIQVHKHDHAANICRKSEDVKAGDLIVAAGTALGAVEIANLISCGVTSVEVARRVRMAVISTGGEIVDTPDELAPGKIMNSNGPMLAALGKMSGIDVVSEHTVPDESGATEQAVRGAMGEADLVVLSGGVSAGEFDCVLEALSDVGLKVHFSRLAVQPGKPTVFATAGEKVVFGLPGNPVPVFLMFHLFVLRAVAHLTGRAPGMRMFRLRLASDYTRKKAERYAFMPAGLTENGEVEPMAYHGSAHLAALLRADGFFAVPIGVSQLRKGEVVTFMPISRGSVW